MWIGNLMLLLAEPRPMIGLLGAKLHGGLPYPAPPFRDLRVLLHRSYTVDTRFSTSTRSAALSAVG
jgi:hypothetical protein